MATGLSIGDSGAAATMGRGVAPFWVTARMRMTLIRRDLRDQNAAAWTYLGAAAGLLLAAGTIWVAVVHEQLLAPALGLWLLGWMIGPLLTARGEPLRPEYFAPIGLAPGRLAMALLGGTVVGFGPLVSAVAASSLVVYGFRSGLGAGLLSIPAMVLTLLVFISAAKLSAGVYALLVRLPVGAGIAGLMTGFVLAFAAQGWALVAAFLAPDLAPVLDVAARVLPSGWGVVAIEAAAGAAGMRAAGALLGMLVLSVIAIGVWARLLGHRSVTRAVRTRPWRLLRARDADGAALAKERRSVLRDPLQVNRLVLALSYALSFVLMPVALGWTGLVPWAAPIFVVMVVAAAANLYGNDGTGVWQVIAVPGGVRRDVRARQRAFLVMVAIPTIVITAATVWWVDAPRQWPYVIATLPALVGAGSGLAVLVSVYAPSPTTDPHKRGANPLATGASAEATGTMYLAMGAAMITAAPAVVAVLLWGWWGTLVGLLTGVVCWQLFGRLAARRLDASATELLALLRRGRPADSTAAATATGLAKLSKMQRRLVMICFLFGAIPLFPQGIVPLVFLIVGNPARVWFLAMYLPSPVSWIVAIAMIMLGVTMYVYGFVVYSMATRQATVESA